MTWYGVVRCKMRFKNVNVATDRPVIIPWRNTIPFQELIGDHFRVDVKRNGDHFGVDLGIISGLKTISGSGSFRGLYSTRFQASSGDSNSANWPGYEAETFVMGSLGPRTIPPGRRSPCLGTDHQKTYGGAAGSAKFASTPPPGLKRPANVPQ